MTIETIQKKIKSGLMGLAIAGACVFQAPMGGCDGAINELLDSGVLEQVLDEVIGGGLPDDGFGDPTDLSDPFGDGFDNADDSWEDFPF